MKVWISHKFIRTEIPIISPNNILKFFWDFLIMLTTLTHFFLIVFFLTFHEDPEFVNLYKNWLGFIIILIPIDIIQKLNSGFFANGTPIKVRSKIFQKYYKTEMFYDFIVLIILLINYIHLDFSSEYDFIRFFQVGYFVKYPIFQNLINNFEEIINFDEKVEASISILKLFVKLLFFAHLVACLWFYIGKSGQYQDDN